MKLSDAIVVITGGAGALGCAMAKLLISKGARVVLCDNNKILLWQAQRQLGVTAFCANVTKESQLTNVAQKTTEQFGKIDLWINNAGLWMPREGIDKIKLKEAHKLWNINFWGTVHGMRVAFDQMQKQKQGTIMNIISTTAFDGMNGSSGAMYVASKYALRGLTNAARNELKGTLVKIIGVYPGGFQSPIFDQAQPKAFQEFMMPEDVAKEILANLEKQDPETQFIIKRPGQPSLQEPII